MTIHLVLVDDHPVVLEGIAYIIEYEPDLAVVARCTDGNAALEALRAHRPDILVLDLKMPRMSGMAVLRQAAKEGLKLKVVLLTTEISEEDLIEAVRLGVRGIMLKETAPDLLVRCIRTVYGGGQWLEHQLTGWTLERLLAREASLQQAAKVLTTREIELACQVSQGLRNKEVATRLGITEGTVKIHLQRIYSKLGMSSRVELANYARRELD